MLTPGEIVEAADEDSAALGMMVWCMDQNARMTGHATDLVIEGLELDVERLRAENQELRRQLQAIRERVLWIIDV